MGGISWGGQRGLPKLFGWVNSALYVLDLHRRAPRCGVVFVSSCAHRLRGGSAWLLTAVATRAVTRGTLGCIPTRNAGTRGQPAR